MTAPGSKGRPWSADAATVSVRPLRGGDEQTGGTMPHAGTGEVFYVAARVGNHLLAFDSRGGAWDIHR